MRDKECINLGRQIRLRKGWKGGKMAADICDKCVNYIYDEENECYCCLVNLDEDEMYRFLSGTRRECPYFRLEDEYGVVRRQM